MSLHGGVLAGYMGQQIILHLNCICVPPLTFHGYMQNKDHTLTTGTGNGELEGGGSFLSQPLSGYQRYSHYVYISCWVCKYLFSMVQVSDISLPYVKQTRPGYHIKQNLSCGISMATTLCSNRSKLSVSKQFQTTPHSHFTIDFVGVDDSKF